MSGEWAGVIERRDFVVFGRHLQPLTMRHLYLLITIDSPVLTGAPADEADLLLAVWLCTWPAEVAQRSLERPTSLSTQFRAWGASWGSKAVGDGSLLAEAAVFHEYLLYWMRAPRRWGSEGGKIVTPWVLFLCSELRRHYGCSEAEVWSMAPTKAFAMYAAISEAHGSDSLMSEADQIESDRINAEAAAEAAQKGGQS